MKSGGIRSIYNTRKFATNMSKKNYLFIKNIRQYLDYNFFIKKELYILILYANCEFSIWGTKMFLYNSINSWHWRLILFNISRWQQGKTKNKIFYVRTGYLSNFECDFDRFPQCVFVKGVMGVFGSSKGRDAFRASGVMFTTQ